MAHHEIPASLEAMADDIHEQIGLLVRGFATVTGIANQMVDILYDEYLHESERAPHAAQILGFAERMNGMTHGLVEAENQARWGFDSFAASLSSEPNSVAVDWQQAGIGACLDQYRHLCDMLHYCLSDSAVLKGELQDFVKLRHETLRWYWGFLGVPCIPVRHVDAEGNVTTQSKPVLTALDECGDPGKSIEECLHAYEASIVLPKAIEEFIQAVRDWFDNITMRMVYSPPPSDGIVDEQAWFRD